MSFNPDHCIALIPQQPIWQRINIAPPPVQIQLDEVTESTNARAWDLLRQGAEEPDYGNRGLVAIALQQRSGRGQWGRQWQSPPGGLYLSLGLVLDRAATVAPQITLCTAWGIATALRDRGLPVTLKWPNDLILAGRKLGGILTETRIQQGRVIRAVVGVGINWQNPVPPTGISVAQWTMKREDGAIASLEDLAAVVISGVLAGCCRWQQQGIDALLPDYHCLLSHRGQAIAIQGQTGTITGVSAQGDLLVQVPTEEAGEAQRAIALPPGSVQLGYAPAPCNPGPELGNSSGGSGDIESGPSHDSAP